MRSGVEVILISHLLPLVYAAADRHGQWPGVSVQSNR